MRDDFKKDTGFRIQNAEKRNGVHDESKNVPAIDVLVNEFSNNVNGMR